MSIEDALLLKPKYGLDHTDYLLHNLEILTDSDFLERFENKEDIEDISLDYLRYQHLRDKLLNHYKR
jgi:hypothetical protein